MEAQIQEDVSSLGFEVGGLGIQNQASGLGMLETGIGDADLKQPPHAHAEVVSEGSSSESFPEFPTIRVA